MRAYILHGAVRCGAVWCGAGLNIEVCGAVRAPALDDGAGAGLFTERRCGRAQTFRPAQGSNAHITSRRSQLVSRSFIHRSPEGGGGGHQRYGYKSLETLNHPKPLTHSKIKYKDIL